VVHDSHTPPEPIKGPTCKGCINLGYRRVVVGKDAQGREQTGVGTYHCWRFATKVIASEIPRPQQEDCYRAKL
jgi:hypothetical protein